MSNSGSNFVFLNLGSASFVTPDSLACVQYSKTGNSYSVSSAFDVLVTITNSASPSYRLAAEISNAPPSGVTWLVNGVTMSTAYTTIQTANTYAHPVTQTLTVNVKNTAAAQTLFEGVGSWRPRIRICFRTLPKSALWLSPRCWLSPVWQKVRPRLRARSYDLDRCAQGGGPGGWYAPINHVELYSNGNKNYLRKIEERENKQ